ncbi:MAG: prevent-host-death protein [Acidobacteria bacterium]|nr:MAG: prevent-host-death protein [Acidobacteriota bacterium]
MTTVMKAAANTISKSQFKTRALEYFRGVEKTRKPLIITDRGRAVLKIVPFSDDPQEVLEKLHDSVVRYDTPTQPVGERDWEALR